MMITLKTKRKKELVKADKQYQNISSISCNQEKDESQIRKEMNQQFNFSSSQINIE